VAVLAFSSADRLKLQTHEYRPALRDWNLSDLVQPSRSEPTAFQAVWVTKYRYKILRGRIAERVRALIRQICEAREVTIVRGAVSPDHIHMLVSAPAHMAPAKLAQYIKGRSSQRLQDEFPELRKRYWGQHLWARGYFCATVGVVDEPTIKAYIKSQRWDEDDQGFKVTAPTEP
jgi:putative transposase